ncbi:MAG: nitrogen fixation protein NifQ [Pseudomonadota bacterium]
MTQHFPTLVHPGYSPAWHEDLASIAIASVLKHVQEGRLPLFAGTLGLPQPERLSIVDACSPENNKPAEMPEQEYAAILATCPPEFLDLVQLLLDHRSAYSDQHADWLARAIAAATFGTRHLWQDLGLSGRTQVSALLSNYFPSLHRRNVQDLKWKKFLYAELGLRQGNPGLRPPECNHCDQFRICFPEAEKMGKDAVHQK